MNSDMDLANMKFVTVNTETLRISDFLRDSSGQIVGVVEVAVEGFAPAPPAVDPEKKPEEKEDIKDIFERSRKPPHFGPCRGCGHDKALNRLDLCHSCWTKKNLLDDAKAGKNPDWIPGDVHPEYCGCGLPEHFGGPRI